jgi:lipid-A-disaccharide synthase-like uncharacterized protein
MTGLLNYFYDVFIVKFDAWVALGFVAQAFFTKRLLVQWIASSQMRPRLKAKRSAFLPATMNG